MPAARISAGIVHLTHMPPAARSECGDELLLVRFQVRGPRGGWVRPSDPSLPGSPCVQSVAMGPQRGSVEGSHCVWSASQRP